MKKLSKLDLRTPEWGSQFLIERTCPICDAMGKPYLERPDELITNLCNKCGTYFISPAPDYKCLELFYSSYHEKYSMMPKVSPEVLRVSYDKINPLADIRIKKLASLFDLSKTSVLDIGFGQPFILYMLKNLGAKTHGVDIDPKAIEYGHHLGLDSVFEGEIFDYQPTLLFDVVIMTDFVEHPLNPMDYIKKALSFLRIGGMLLIWTPNGSGEITKEEPITFRVDLEHMQYFTSNTIQHLLKEFNLRLLHFETIGQPFIPLAEKDNHKKITKWQFNLKQKLKARSAKMIKSFIQEKYETNSFSYEIGNYHLFTILEKQ
jgi:2-polyprenyl-3-methyl-5-hydroxy-6-metoxy-1,4-benzoquinol methylase